MPETNKERSLTKLQLSVISRLPTPEFETLVDLIIRCWSSGIRFPVVFLSADSLGNPAAQMSPELRADFDTANAEADA